MSTHTITADGAAAVATDVFWLSLDTCPRGVKVLMLGAGGTATVSEYDGKNKFWTGWHPLPKKPEWMK